MHLVIPPSCVADATDARRTFLLQDPPFHGHFPDIGFSALPMRTSQEVYGPFSGDTISQSTWNPRDRGSGYLNRGPAPYAANRNYNRWAATHATQPSSPIVLFPKPTTHGMNNAFIICISNKNSLSSSRVLPTHIADALLECGAKLRWSSYFTGPRLSSCPLGRRTKKSSRYWP